MTELLILDKVRWVRGTTEPNNTKLLDSSGGMCCLGFCMAKHGFPAENLLGTAEPAEAVGNRGKIDVCPSFLVTCLDDDECDVDEDGETIPSFYDTQLTGQAMAINDEPTTTDEQKVAMLNEEFSKVGVKVILVDTPEECEALGGLPANFAKDILNEND